MPYQLLFVTRESVRGILSAIYAAFELCGPAIQVAPLGPLRGLDSCLQSNHSRQSYPN